MGKTLAIILNHNTPDITDFLYNQLKPFEDLQNFELCVLDNGSPESGQSIHTTDYLKKNIFFGGALNYAFKKVLKKPDYDSLLFLNSDIIVNGEILVKTLREKMFNYNYDILAPSISTNWTGYATLNMHKHMRSWGTDGIRDVKYVDFQCPLFNRTFIEHVKSFSDDLMYGIGQDLFAGMICEDNDMKIGVVDSVNVYHEWAHTLRSNSSKLNLQNFAVVSNEAMNAYAKVNGLSERLSEFFKYGREYGKTC